MSKIRTDFNSISVLKTHYVVISITTNYTMYKLSNDLRFKVKQLNHTTQIAYHIKVAGIEFNEFTQLWEMNETSHTLESLRTAICDIPLNSALRKSISRIKSTDKKVYKPRILKGEFESAVRGLRHTGIIPSYSPVERYLTGLKDSPLPTYEDALKHLQHCANQWLGCSIDSFETQLFIRWSISAVARTYEPGCRARGVLMLIGKQGTGKTTFFQALCPNPEWFTTLNSTLKSDDFVRQLTPLWIGELGEVDSHFKTHDQSQLKAQISETFDSHVPKFVEETKRSRRHTVFGATSNQSEPLIDDTGNTRFWPIRIAKEIPIDDVSNTRDDYWKAALALYESGEQWHLTARELGLLEAHSQGFQSEAIHPYRNQLTVFVERLEQTDYQLAFTSTEVAQHILGIRNPNGKQTRQISQDLQWLGFERKPARLVSGKVIQAWRNPDWTNVIYASDSPGRLIAIANDVKGLTAKDSLNLFQDSPKSASQAIEEDAPF
jgi:predicted P-loop ATPase